jgi:hypothetical protein
MHSDASEHHPNVLLFYHSAGVGHLPRAPHRNVRINFYDPPVDDISLSLDEIYRSNARTKVYIFSEIIGRCRSSRSH